MYLFLFFSPFQNRSTNLVCQIATSCWSSYWAKGIYCNWSLFYNRNNNFFNYFYMALAVDKMFRKLVFLHGFFFFITFRENSLMSMKDYLIFLQHIITLYPFDWLRYVNHYNFMKLLTIFTIWDLIFNCWSIFFIFPWKSLLLRAGHMLLVIR